MEVAGKNQRAPSSKKKNKKKKKRKNDENEREFANIAVSNDNCNWKSFQQKIISQSTRKPAKQSAVPHHATKRQETKKIHPSRTSETKLPVRKLKQSGSSEVTNAVAIDCEMVGVDTGNESMLARVSIVNKFGNCIYDKYVKPTEHVVDYRTPVSGIRPKDLINAETFETVQKEVAEIIKGRILVGHALKNDLKVLYLSHPRRYIRDTARYKGFRKLIKGGTPGLKKLAKELLSVTIQEGEHDSVVDARTAMQLYILYKKEWEKAVRSRNKGVIDNKTEK